jgi:hypothetical protein
VSTHGPDSRYRIPCLAAIRHAQDNLNAGGVESLFSSQPIDLTEAGIFRRQLFPYLVAKGTPLV